MLKITLVCCAGMSTSMLIGKMIEAAKNRGLEADIEAYAETELDANIAGTEILLLAPQVRYLKNSLRAKYGAEVKVVDVINISDYGLLNGEKVLAAALAAYSQP